MKNIVIIGAGGIGREVAWIIEEINDINPTWNILGFIDDNPEMKGKVLNGYNVLGDIDHLKALKEKPYIIVAISNPKVKSYIVRNLESKFNFATIVYPTVRISKYIELGEGTIIYPNTTLTINSKIGNHVIISGNCGIGHDTEIKDYSAVLWGSSLSGYNVIEEECLLGVGTSMKQGIKIGKGNILTAGKVVIYDIE